MAHDKAGDMSKFVSQTVTVSGAVEKPLTLSVDDLKNFPVLQIDELKLTRQNGANAGKLENFKGVRLRDILEKAVVIARDHNDVKKTVIIATATDDYKVVYSWSELFNTAVGEGVLVFFEKNGQALADDEGRIAMISGKDLRTGPRHVKWLKSIEVRKLID
ncbi:molybdopterin-dependent oxidoreductase [Undibacterium sp. CY18W]|uniref:Molybdopterin-dependent oxidoreductase n=2 Tax=Undibacterium hunanense TaxID=2762292 RepID=A0ABR6ZVL8_9BURK|nr:molybdopterin-dependent oxidoreductase [Undibacterium hunanense]